MKFFFILMMTFLSVSCVDEAKNAETSVKQDQVTSEVKKEEDCDDKAKKPIEITPTSISLSGNTGCSLDEAKP